MFRVTDIFGEVKYAGRSRAVVLNNADPESRGRIRVNSPLLGESPWIPYLRSPFGFDVPEIGDIVYLECDGGFASHAVAYGKMTKLDGGTPDLHEQFQRPVPTNRGFYTPEGHLLELDDGEDPIIGTEKGIRLTTSSGKQAHFIDDPTKSAITIVDEMGNKINIDSLTNVMDIQIQSTKVQIDGIQDKIEMSAAFGDTLSISAADGIQASTPTGTSLSMKSAEVTLTSGQGTLKLDPAGRVALGGPTAELLDLFDQMLQALTTLTTAMQAETHISNLGYPSAPPTNAPSYAAVQTQLMQIKVLLTTIKGSL